MSFIIASIAAINLTAYIIYYWSIFDTQRAMSAFCSLQQDWPQNYRQPEGLKLFQSQKGWAGDIEICPKILNLSSSVSRLNLIIHPLVPQ